MKYPFLSIIAQKSADLLGLSAHGALKILPYEDEVHTSCFAAYIDSAPARSGTVSDSLKFYLYFCNDYCRCRYIDVDFSLMNKAAKKYQIDLTAGYYLPETERVKVAIPKDRDHKENNPYRSVTHPWKVSRSAFKFSPKDKQSSIDEAIRLVGYKAAGLVGKIISNIPEPDGFIYNAERIIEQNKQSGITYELNWPLILEQFNEFVDYAIQNWHPEIDPEKAKYKAAQAMADFIPQLLEQRIKHPFFPLENNPPL